MVDILSIDGGGVVQFALPIFNWTPVKGSILLGTTDDVTAQIKNLVAWIGAEFNLDVNGEDAIYMEIDRYNSN